MAGLKNPTSYQKYFVPENSTRDDSFYDNHIAHYMARFGKKIEYLPVDADTLVDDIDYIFGEDTTRNYSGSTLYTLTAMWEEVEEMKMWGTFGIVPTDEITMEIHKSTFVLNTGQKPKEHDWIKTSYNGLVYEVISVSDDSKIFKGTKFTYLIEARPRIVDAYTATEAMSASGGANENDGDYFEEISSFLIFSIS